MRFARMLTLSLLLISGMASGAHAQIGPAGGDKTSGPDARVQTLLDKLGYKYTVTKSGNYKLTFETEDGRSQVVIVNSTTETYKNFEIREIWSTAYETSGSLSGEVALKLLEDSELSKLGFWVVSKGESKSIAVYEVRLAANADTESLNSALINVTKSADVMEKKLTDGDEF